MAVHAVVTAGSVSDVAVHAVVTARSVSDVAVHGGMSSLAPKHKVMDCHGLRPRNDEVFIYGLVRTMYSSTASQ